MLGGGYFKQNTEIKPQFKLSQRQIKILLTSYVHDGLSTTILRVRG
jgi:hypothetical protein